MNKQIVSFDIHLEQETFLLHFSSENGFVEKYSWNSNRHCNAEYELHVILRGNCYLDVEDCQYKLCAGHAILIPPGKYHKAYKSSTAFERFSFGFTLSEGPLLSSLKKSVKQSTYFCPSVDFLAICKRFILETNNRKPFKCTMQQALITEMLVNLFRELQLAHYTEARNTQAEGTARTHLIDDYFEKHFTEKGGCSVLAKQLNLSTRQLNRVLQEHYGMSFQEKLIQAKMDHAALLLRTTDKHVQDIVNLVGYNSVTTFYKAFYAQFHVTPKQYRRKSK